MSHYRSSNSRISVLRYQRQHVESPQLLIPNAHNRHPYILLMNAFRIYVSFFDYELLQSFPRKSLYSILAVPSKHLQYTHSDSPVRKPQPHPLLPCISSRIHPPDSSSACYLMHRKRCTRRGAGSCSISAVDE
jgi:hypothetical protein